MIFNKQFFIFFSVFIVLNSCSNEKESIFFCDKEYRDSNMTLSKQLNPLHDLIEQKSGVHVLEEGDAAMISRAWLSEYAEKTIDVQYFIFSADNVGLIATDFLLRAADRGVKVRILVDDIMVEANAIELLALDAHPNLSIKIYNPCANVGKNLVTKLYSMAKDFKGFNQRMHNKTFIVDGKVVITGGRNIADEYFDYDHEYNFRDRDVLLLGKVCNDVQSSFDLFWNNEISVPMTEIEEADKEELNAEEKYAYLHQYACNPKNFWPQVRTRIDEIPQYFEAIQKSGALVWLDDVRFVSDLPGKNKVDELDGGGVTSDTLSALIQRAKKSILIQSPYLITTEESRKLLTAAVNRGVDVKILTNSLASTDNLEAFSGYQRDREELLATGVHIYEFKPDAAVRKKLLTGALNKDSLHYPIFGLHAKTMLIDDKISVIGTFNFDPRSVNLNTECLTIITSDAVAKELKLNLLEDIKPENAWETTLTTNPDSVCTFMKRVKAKSRRVVPKSIL
jgi:putative cardiolipin synthase